MAILLVLAVVVAVVTVVMPVFDRQAFSTTEFYLHIQSMPVFSFSFPLYDSFYPSGYMIDFNICNIKVYEKCYG